MSSEDDYSVNLSHGSDSDYSEAEKAKPKRTSSRNKKLVSDPVMNTINTKGLKRKYEGITVTEQDVHEVSGRRKKTTPGSAKLLEKLEAKISSGIELSPEEEKEYQKQARLKKNREAAHMSRLRKKVYVDQLEERVTFLSEENSQLIQDMAVLKRQNEDMKKEVEKLQYTIECLKSTFNQPGATTSNKKRKLNDSQEASIAEDLNSDENESDKATHDYSSPKSLSSPGGEGEKSGRSDNERRRHGSSPSSGKSNKAVADKTEQRRSARVLRKKVIEEEVSQESDPKPMEEDTDQPSTEPFTSGISVVEPPISTSEPVTKLQENLPLKIEDCQSKQQDYYAPAQQDLQLDDFLPLQMTTDDISTNLVFGLSNEENCFLNLDPLY